MNKTLFVAWRTGKGPEGWGPVARLERLSTGYRFLYTRGAEILKGFRPFPGMSNINEIYESDELFPLFTCRLLNKSRPEYKDYLTW